MDQGAYNNALTSPAERILSRMARAEIVVAGRRRCSFRVCGAAGFVFALALACWLGVRIGLSLPILAWMAADGAVVLVGVTMLTKILSGEERIVFYHHQLALLVSVTLLAHAFHRPVLPYLDVTAQCLAIFLACGRCGCFMVGCCHGRPASRGVRYTFEHVAAGFPACYRDVPLFPVQLVEAACVLTIAAMGAALLLKGAPAGIPLAWYLGSQAIVRFAVEFLRGDDERRFFLGFSEPQWTALAIACAAGFILPACGVCALFIAASMLATALLCRAGRLHLSGVHGARHAAEIARILSQRTAMPGVSVFSTSLGIRISSGSIGSTAHYALSATGSLDPDAARTLARLIVRLRHRPSDSVDLLASRSGLFHVLVRA